MKEKRLNGTSNIVREMRRDLNPWYVGLEVK